MSENRQDCCDITASVPCADCPRRKPDAWQIRDKHGRWITLPGDWQESENIEGREYRPLTNQPLPWGINTIGSPYHPDVHAGLPDGRYVHAVCEPHDMGRFRAAWWVLTGRAYAFLWPKAGELEGVFQRLNPPQLRPSPRPFVPQADSRGRANQ